MSVGFSNSWRGAGTIVFLLSVTTFSVLRAADEPRPRGRPIEFSDVNGGTSSTNAITLGSHSLRPNSLEPSGQLDSLDFRSGQPVALPPPSSGPVVSRKRNKQSDDWASPDDVINNYVMEHILGLPGYFADFSDDEQATRFPSTGNRGSLSRGRGRTNSAAGKRISFGGREGASDDQPDARTERGSGRATLFDGTMSSAKTLINVDRDGFDLSARRLEGSSGLFGDNRRVDTTADEKRDRKMLEQQLDTFRKNLSFQTPAPAENFKPVAITPTPGFAPVGGTFSSAPQTPLGSWPGVANPAFYSGVPTAPTAPSAPGLPGYVPPAPPDPNRFSRPEPVVVAPRRQF
jgi:hypothetical protein